MNLATLSFYEGEIEKATGMYTEIIKKIRIIMMLLYSRTMSVGTI